MHFTKQTLIVLLVLCTGCFQLASATETSTESNDELSLKQLLLMPGKLTHFHAETESKCDACHLDFEKSNQTKLCLDCHKEVRTDVAKKLGFHGALDKSQISECKKCHTDHKGRDFDIRNLDQHNFDHSMTNFDLQGKHSLVACQQCHKTDKRSFRIEKKECVDCHKDFHEGELGTDCKSCHSPKGWKLSQFDHSKTDFPLDGAHEPLSCNQCHFGGELKKIPTTCESCHSAADPHLGLMEKSCDSCHITKDWKKTSFKHNKDTDFKLRGAHKKLICQACHLQKLKPAKTCVGCHKEDDIHHGANGNKCESCHSEKKWKTVSFDHDKDTKFPLLGGHSEVECDSCHFGERPEAKLGLVRGCVDCHRADDPHLGKLGEQCATCHQEQGWNKDTKFSHEFTKFPLTGAHQLLICESCHSSKNFTEQGDRCVDCHKQQDPHENSFGEKCDTCHNTAAFVSWQFDHDEQTNYPLKGSHTNLQCKLCHLPGVEVNHDINRACIDCHREEDVHDGTFGQNCGQCHNVKSFSDFEY